MDDFGYKDNIVIKMAKRLSECVTMKFICYMMLMEFKKYILIK